MSIYTSTKALFIPNDFATVLTFPKATSEISTLIGILGPKFMSSGVLLANPTGISTLYPI